MYHHGTTRTLRSHIGFAQVAHEVRQFQVVGSIPTTKGEREHMVDGGRAASRPTQIAIHYPTAKVAHATVTLIQLADAEGITPCATETCLAAHALGPILMLTTAV